MKKLLIIVCLSSLLCYGQSSSKKENAITKGNIHFTFNGEKYELPISQVTLRKENHIILSLRAEHNDSTSRQMIAIEIGLTQLSMDSLSINRGVKIEVSTRDNLTSTGHDLYLNMTEGMEFAKEKGDFTHYGYYNKGERVSWDLTSVAMGFTKCGLNYDGKNLKICAGFDIDFKTTLNGVKEKVVGDLKDCFLEVIL